MEISAFTNELFTSSAHTPLFMLHALLSTRQLTSSFSICTWTGTYFFHNFHFYLTHPAQFIIYTWNGVLVKVLTVLPRRTIASLASASNPKHIGHPLDTRDSCLFPTSKQRLCCVLKAWPQLFSNYKFFTVTLSMKPNPKPCLSNLQTTISSFS